MLRRPAALSGKGFAATRPKDLRQCREKVCRQSITAKTNAFPGKLRQSYGYGFFSQYKVIMHPALFALIPYSWLMVSNAISFNAAKEAHLATTLTRSFLYDTADLSWLIADLRGILGKPILRATNRLVAPSPLPSIPVALSLDDLTWIIVTDLQTQFYFPSCVRRKNCVSTQSTLSARDFEAIVLA